MNRPDLSVIVVTWKGADLAETTVRRVLQRRGALEVEVLVVDNASGDGTADTLRTAFAGEARVRVLDAGANLGFPRANNLALDQARGRHVLFLNPDTEVGEGTLEACVAELDGDASVGVVGCRIEYPDGRIQYEGARRAYRLRHVLFEGLYLHVLFPASRVFAHHLMGDFDHRGTDDVEAVMGSFLMTPRRLALELGGLPDELFMYHEDLAYCLRARRAGHRVRYRGDVATVHHGAVSSSRHPAPLELLAGEVRVRLLRERGGWLAGAAARGAFAFRQAARLLLALPAAALAPVRRRYPQVAAVGIHLRLLAWTVWPRAVWARLERAGVPRDGRPPLLVIGPTPPPVHGVSAYVGMLAAFLPLRARFRVRTLDIADRRGLENIGRWDLVNVTLGLRHLLELAGTLAAHRPKVTYVPVAQSAPAFFRDVLFVTMSRLAGSRPVLHVHGGGFRAFHEDSGAFMRFLIRWTLGRAAQVWVLGEGLRGQVEHLVPAQRVRVVANGVPDPLDGDPAWAPGAAGGARPPSRDDAAPLRLLFLSQVSAWKGVEVVLAAAESLVAEGTPFHLTLAGGWAREAERRTLGPRIRALEEAGVLHVPGVVTGTAKDRLLLGSDVFLLPTRYPLEGQPLAILEAMSAGLPVVATPRAAIPDMVVDGETGFLVPEGDPEAVVRAVRALAEDRGACRRLGAAGRARYEARFTARAALGRATEALADALG